MAKGKNREKRAKKKPLQRATETVDQLTKLLIAVGGLIAAASTIFFSVKALIG